MQFPLWNTLGILKAPVFRTLQSSVARILFGWCLTGVWGGPGFGFFPFMAPSIVPGRGEAHHPLLLWSTSWGKKWCKVVKFWKISPEVLCLPLCHLKLTNQSHLFKSVLLVDAQVLYRKEAMWTMPQLAQCLQLFNFSLILTVATWLYFLRKLFVDQTMNFLNFSFLVLQKDLLFVQR